MLEELKLRLSRVQDEIKGLGILNQVYGKTLDREKADYSELLTTEGKNLMRLKEQDELIKLIAINLKARAEKIENLKLEGKWLKEDIEKGGYNAFDILDRTRHKPKEFFVDSKYI